MKAPAYALNDYFFMAQDTARAAVKLLENHKHGEADAAWFAAMQMLKVALEGENA